MQDLVFSGKGFGFRIKGAQEDLARDQNENGSYYRISDLGFWV